MVPDEDSAIALTYRPRVGTGSWFAIQSRHFGELAIAVKAPTMERTGDSVPADPAADAQVGSQVGAVGVEDPGNFVLASEEDEIMAEVGHRSHLAWCEVCSGADAEPAVGGGGERVSGVHRASWGRGRPMRHRGTGRRRREAEDPHL